MTSPQGSRHTQPVEYKGEPLDAARGPGLGCFWFQMVVLGVVVILTPLSVQWGWPSMVSAVLLVLVIALLLLTGQTMIFLLRLVAAGRTEGRRRPLASASPTVGELEDELPAEADADATAAVPGSPEAAPGGDGGAGPASGSPDPSPAAGNDGSAMRQ